ncbi:MAG: hypothetical protein J6T04_09830 [Bacteroidales bacterium]|nr:hypothetical protein [Bacteroidales bacterium]
MKAKTIYKILHFIPLWAILGIIAIAWSDPFFNLIFIVAFGPIVLAILVFAVLSVIFGIKAGGMHAIAIISLCVVIVIAFVLLLTVRIPNYDCDPFKMKKFYEKNGNKLNELVQYSLNSAENRQLLDSAGNGKYRNNCFIGRDSKYVISEQLLHDSNSVYLEDIGFDKVGIEKEEFESIKRRLINTGCQNIEISADYCDVGYKYVGLGLYSFRIYSRDLTEEEKKSYMDDPCFLPYNRRVLFEFGGGAVGPQSFGAWEIDEYLKDNPPDW